MKMSFATGAIAGVVIATAGGAVAGYRLYETAHYASVVSASPLTDDVKVPRKECHDEAVTRTQPVKDHDRLIGTGIGALVGGVLGHQVGGGNGKTIATVAGAAAGGYAGNKIQQRQQQRNTYTTTEKRCSTAYDVKQVPAGFDVLYEYKGEQHHVHMDQDPGSKLPVKDGKVVLTAQAKGSTDL